MIIFWQLGIVAIDVPLLCSAYIYSVIVQRTVNKAASVTVIYARRINICISVNIIQAKYIICVRTKFIVMRFREYGRVILEH